MSENTAEGADSEFKSPEVPSKRPGKDKTRKKEEEKNDDSDDELIGPEIPSTSSGAEESEKLSEKTSGEPKKKRKKVLEFEDTYLREIPKAQAYEKSFMHRDVITHVCATKTDFILTASSDGNVKFWKKLHKEGIEFVKHFRTFLGSIQDMAVSTNGSLMAVISEGMSMKIFDVVNFDMINMMKLTFIPRTCAWIHHSADPISAVAVSDKDSSTIYVFDGKGAEEPLHKLEKLHMKSVGVIQYNPLYDIAVSADDLGMVEYWHGLKKEFSFPGSLVEFDSKMDTDLYVFVKAKVAPTDLVFSPDGKDFATFASDRKIRIFKVATGKVWKVIDESIGNYLSEKDPKGLANTEFNRRIAVEKELDRNPSAFKLTKLCWDHSGNFLLFPTLFGIKVVNVKTNRCVRYIGKPENLRFLAISLCRAVPGLEAKDGTAVTAQMRASDNPALKEADPDPVLVASAYKKNRFYLFTNAEPFSTDAFTDGEDVTGNERDVFNEKPLKEDIITATDEIAPDKRLSDNCVIHTTFGDIFARLFPKECPKTVENFCTHARKGYFNGLLFHRSVKGFMIQTGDPTGKGSGGESIWGGDFEDEFHPTLRHDKPFTVSMANAGPNTNGSQFFITVVPTPHLDNKHTVFGRVWKGMETVQSINKVPASIKTGRPRDEIRVISITLK